MTATALEQQREDAALGAAWRRCEAALQTGSDLILWRNRAGGHFTARVMPWSQFPKESDNRAASADTATAALTALADALEARREQADGSFSIDQYDNAPQP